MLSQGYKDTGACRQAEKLLGKALVANSDNVTGTQLLLFGTILAHSTIVLLYHVEAVMVFVLMVE